MYSLLDYYNMIISKEVFIIICDNRAAFRCKWFFKLSEDSKDLYRHYKVIRRVGNKPITLGYILYELSKDKHYQKEQRKSTYKHFQSIKQSIDDNKLYFIIFSLRKTIFDRVVSL